MNKVEEKEVGQRFLEIYCGILFHAPRFETGREIACSYDFSNAQYEKLKASYPILEVAGKGGDFVRALRICRWLAPNLSHQSDFSLVSEFEYHSLSLLDYAFGNKQHGINCAGKAKILVECCLALGIFARSIGLYPNSPYDLDNHVVAEIFDRKLQKWIMLDPTTGGYFSDGKNPLSCLEMRERFARNEGGSIVLPRQKAIDLNKLAAKNLSWNYYYAKNCYFITVETVAGFGKSNAEPAYLLPLGFDCKTHCLRQTDYMLKTALRDGWNDTAVNSLKKQLQRYSEFTPLIGSISLWNAP